ncbi:MAG: tagaturonate epimerase family protein [Candidatus Poribacteria bacterium]|nr:tagaturonate epimerase family protein [Candidatus Poribacteria bacterium]
MTPILQPSLLGLNRSFGFGDRLGLATPGHLRACRRGGFAPIFAQQSVREMTRTNRSPQDVISAAQRDLAANGWVGEWGADADHLKTQNDVDALADAGFTFFTIDPSEHVNRNAGRLSEAQLAVASTNLIKNRAYESVGELLSLYLGKSYEVGDSLTIAFDSRVELIRAAVKYGEAVAYAARMADWIATADTPRGYEIEVSVDETDEPTAPLEHLFIALELKRRGVEVVSLAPRFVGDFEKGIDYKGDLAAFEASLKEHVAIARYAGPYKISVHSGSDKFAIYPILGRVCGELLHVKTAGTSYLEALRVLAQTETNTFAEIIDFSRARFDTDKATYHISAELKNVAPPNELSATDRERVYLDSPDGRQILHVTFGSVLTTPEHPFKERLLDALHRHEELHAQLLDAHFTKHIRLLEAG